MGDPSLLARLLEFVVAVGSHWLASLIGVAFVIEPFIESQLPEALRNCLHNHGWGKPETRRRWLRRLGALCLVVAFFQAFDDVNRRLRDVEGSLINRDVVEIPSGAIYEAKKSDRFVTVNTVPGKPTTIKLPATPQKGDRIEVTDDNGYASNSIITVVGMEILLTIIPHLI
jgi:hypothetical protein